MTRDLAIVFGLALAWAACTVAVVLGLMRSPLVVVAGVVVAALVCAPARDATGPAPVEPGPTPPSGWAA